MPEHERERALKDLASRAAKLEASTARAPVADDGHNAVGQAYGVVGQLIGGPLVGLAFGAGVDWLLKSAPVGTIVGVLLGFGVAVFLAWKTAERLRLRSGIGTAVADDEDEER